MLLHWYNSRLYSQGLHQHAPGQQRIKNRSQQQGGHHKGADSS